MNWKIIGGVVAVVVVVVAVMGMRGTTRGPVADVTTTPASTPVAPAPQGVPATPTTGDPSADIDAILSTESSGDTALLSGADQESALVTSDKAALSDMTNAYDATQY